MKYGDLLEAAYNNDRSNCLIYSSNHSICNKGLAEKWKNFITVVPKFDNNIYHKKVNKNNYKDYPFITFGVTINDNKFDWLLYLMDYYKIDLVISDLLKAYINCFMIDLDDYAKNIRGDYK